MLARSRISSMPTALIVASRVSTLRGRSRSLFRGSSKRRSVGLPRTWCFSRCTLRVGLNGLPPRDTFPGVPDIYRPEQSFLHVLPGIRNTYCNPKKFNC
jgi:hypothetical protein